MYFDMARNIAGRIRVINANAGTPNIFWNNALAAVGGGAKAQITSPFAFAAADSHRTPYTFEYLLNVQRQLGQQLGCRGRLPRLAQPPPIWLPRREPAYSRIDLSGIADSFALARRLAASPSDSNSA